MSGDLETARKELTERVMGRKGVVGTAVTERDGRPCLVVYVSDDPPTGTVPGTIRGFRVLVERSGPFRAL
jgi:hypothetical protein